MITASLKIDMSAALFDTNVLIRYTKNDPLAVEAITSYKKRYLSIISWAEVLVGIDDKDQAIVKSFLNKNFNIIQNEFDVMVHVVSLRKTTSLKPPDAIIYGTAKHLGVPLITFDKKDFGGNLTDVIVPK